MSTPSKRVIKMELWFVTTLIIVPISILLIFFVMLGKGHVGIKIIKEITPHLEEIYLRYIETGNYPDAQKLEKYIDVEKVLKTVQLSDGANSNKALFAVRYLILYHRSLCDEMLNTISTPGIFKKRMYEIFSDKERFDRLLVTREQNVDET